MTQRATTAHIPTPCPEPWDAMTPTRDGRHCAVCQTEVIDFAQMTQAEVVNYLYLAARKGRRVCARLTNPVVRKKPYRWLLAAAVLVVWQPASALKLSPQRFNKATSYTLPVRQIPMAIVRGIVLDMGTHQPVAGTSISLKNTATGVSAGPDGAFEFTIPVSQLNAKAFKLIISFIGYNKKQIKVKIEESKHIYDLQIFLNPTLFSDF